MPRLTVDITVELLRDGRLPETKRLVGFAGELLAKRSEYLFEATWNPGQFIRLRGDENGYVLDPESISFAHPPDRLRLFGTSEARSGDCRWFNGSAVFVEHVLKHAGPGFAAAITHELPTPFDTEIRNAASAKDNRWEQLRHSVLLRMVLDQVFGVRVLRGLRRVIAERRRDLLVMLGDVDLAELEYSREGGRSFELLLEVLALSARVFGEKEWERTAAQLSRARAAVQRGEPVELTLPGDEG